MNICVAKLLCLYLLLYIIVVIFSLMGKYIKQYLKKHELKIKQNTLHIMKGKTNMKLWKIKRENNVFNNT